MTVTTRARVLITGAGRGFGAACASEFAAAGWDVIGTVRSTQPAESNIRWVSWDVTSDDDSPLLAVLGDEPLDVLINNAGAGTPGTPLADVDVPTMLATIDVNVGGVLRATRAAQPNLLRAAHPLVINVTSRLGSISVQASGAFRDYGTSYAYRISKAAQNMATVCLAQELAPTVRVWGVHPGRLATDMGRADARVDPAVAARDLRELVSGDDRVSPRFIDLGTRADLPW